MRRRARGVRRRSRVLRLLPPVQAVHAEADQEAGVVPDQPLRLPLHPGPGLHVPPLHLAAHHDVRLVRALPRRHGGMYGVGGGGGVGGVVGVVMLCQDTQLRAGAGRRQVVSTGPGAALPSPGGVAPQFWE